MRNEPNEAGGGMEAVLRNEPKAAGEVEAVLRNEPNEAEGEVERMPFCETIPRRREGWRPFCETKPRVLAGWRPLCETNPSFGQRVKPGVERVLPRCTKWTCVIPGGRASVRAEC